LTVCFQPPWEVVSSFGFSLEEVRQAGPTREELAALAAGEVIAESAGEKALRSAEKAVPGLTVAVEPFGIGLRQTEDEDLRWLLETVLVVPLPPPLRDDATPPQRLAYAFRARPPVEEKMKEALTGVQLLPFVVPDVTTPQRRGVLKESREGGRLWEARHVVVMGYAVGGLEQLAWLEFTVAVEWGLGLRRCLKCDTIFLPVPGNVRYCAACRKDSTYQQLYYYRKKEQMTWAEKEKLRAYWREKKREERVKRRFRRR
jgi:hypothetical protein